MNIIIMKFRNPDLIGGCHIMYNTKSSRRRSVCSYEQAMKLLWVIINNKHRWIITSTIEKTTGDIVITAYKLAKER